MRAFHTTILLGLTCIAAPVAGAVDGPASASAQRPEIHRIVLSDEEGPEGFLLFEVAGTMAPNTDAYLAPYVWDGRVRFVLTDAIVIVRSNSQGHFQGFLAIPVNYQLLQVLILPDRDELGVASTAPMSFLRHLLPLLRHRR
jgi:hypothetical protein